MPAWWNRGIRMPARKSIRSSTVTSGEAYVNTSALIAFSDRSDAHHPLFRRLFADPPKLTTTGLVLAEGHGWFLRRCRILLFGLIVVFGCANDEYRFERIDGD